MNTALVTSCCLAFVVMGFLAILVYSLCVVAGSEMPQPPQGLDNWHRSWYNSRSSRWGYSAWDTEP